VRKDKTSSGWGSGEHRALLAWAGENLPQVRRSVSGQRLQYTSLGIGFVMGLAAHVGGYLLRSWMTTEPLLLVADLLYALGWALWTGVVVVVFVQVVPEAKRRQLKGRSSLPAAQRAKTPATSDQASGDDQTPTAR
jgi:hypothetical protein